MFYFCLLTFGVHLENFLLSFTAKNRNSLALEVSPIRLILRGNLYSECMQNWEGWQHIYA